MSFADKVRFLLKFADTHCKGEEVVDIQFQKAASAVLWYLIVSLFTLKFDENIGVRVSPSHLSLFFYRRRLSTLDCPVNNREWQMTRRIRKTELITRYSDYRSRPRNCHCEMSNLLTIELY
jgi:hypothetical protein